MSRWFLLKDVLLTGTGVAVILSQVLSLHPDGLLLGTGLALTVPTIADHVKALLPSSGGGASSPSSDPHGQQSLPTSRREG
jgi:hypothetical protein